MYAVNTTQVNKLGQLLAPLDRSSLSLEKEKLQDLQDFLETANLPGEACLVVELGVILGFDVDATLILVSFFLLSFTISSLLLIILLNRVN